MNFSVSIFLFPLQPNLKKRTFMTQKTIHKVNADDVEEKILFHCAMNKIIVQRTTRQCR